ncbi:MAG: hypothetical protein NUV70_08595 [Caldiserica bacterium]|jgi:hypothetical protein|nr:hypothetical protein [Caldisericota bacterium]
MSISYGKKAVFENFHSWLEKIIGLPFSHELFKVPEIAGGEIIYEHFIQLFTMITFSSAKINYFENKF